MSSARERLLGSAGERRRRRARGWVWLRLCPGGGDADGALSVSLDVSSPAHRLVKSFTRCRVPAKSQKWQSLTECRSRQIFVVSVVLRILLAHRVPGVEATGLFLFQADGAWRWARVW